MVTSPYNYPELYDARLPASPDCIDFYRGAARQQAGLVLEPACGTGRLAVPIAELGLPVVGLDPAPTTLEAARARAAAAGVTLDLRAGDMRTLALGRPRSRWRGPTAPHAER